MPWLLSTDRAELHHFPNLDTVEGGYAILSHTWGDNEDTFQSVQVIGKLCREEGTNPRGSVSPKIRSCCRLAEGHGYRWVWIDTCCIDKTSSTELSEAINSMFQWYSQAEVCYAYLADVPSDCDLEAPRSAFRTSRWHTRGWTLQELIAPSTVIFVSNGWTRLLGSKSELGIARLLDEITGIPWRLLMEMHHFSHYSIAVRMSWASKRNATRVEDEAYCLMGLFNVNMPTIYGEGTHAFQRLQQEIMKNSSDASLFAWGGIMDEQSSDSDVLTSFPLRPIGVHLDVSYLLAPSPRSFERAIDFVPMLRRSKGQPYPPRVEDNAAQADTETKREGPFDHIELPTFTFSSYGVACRLPVCEVDGFTVAVLLCLEGDDHLGLLLEEDAVRSNRDPTRPRYYVSATFRKSVDASRAIQATRIVRLGNDLYDLRFNGNAVKARWRDIHIIPHSSGWVLPNTSLSHLRLEPMSDAPFRIPKWLTARFTALGFKPFQRTWGSRRSPSTSSRKSDSLLVSFTDPWRSEYIDIFLGMCYDLPGVPTPWARAISGHGDHAPSDPESDADAPGPSHDCSRHHIDSWPAQTKAFGDADRPVQLSFTPYRLNPRVAVLHLELLGGVYEDMLHEANVAIPSREDLRLPTQGVSIPSVSSLEESTDRPFSPYLDVSSDFSQFLFPLTPLRASHLGEASDPYNLWTLPTRIKQFDSSSLPSGSQSTSYEYQPYGSHNVYVSTRPSAARHPARVSPSPPPHSTAQPSAHS